MTKGEELKRTLKSKEDIADKDRQQRDVESKRKMVGDIIGAVTSPLGRIGSSIIGKGVKNTTKYLVNDPKWYKKWVANTDRFTNLVTFNNAHVPQMGLNHYEYDNNGSLAYNWANCGVMEIGYQPMLGVAKSNSGLVQDTIPMNIALARTISQIRKFSGRQASYNPDVLGFYWASAIEIATFLSDLKSVLELILLYDAGNTYVPDAIIRAKGWDPSFIKSNAAELRKIYVQYATRFNANLVIPGELSWLQRRVWLPSVVLKDADLRRGQYYVFHQVLYGALRSDETAVDFVADSSIKVSLSTVEAYLANAFSVLEESVTMTALLSDLRAAIPSDKYAKLPVELSNEAPIFGASHEVLAQIHNMRGTPFAITFNGAASVAKIQSNGTYLYHVTGTTETNHQFSGANEAAAFARIINNDILPNVALDSYAQEVSEDEFLVSTRLTALFSCIITGTNNDTVQVVVDSCGTELVVFTKYHFYDAVAGAPDYQTHGTFIPAVNFKNFEVINCMFDWSPLRYTFEISNNNGQKRNVAIVGELGNAFTISHESMANIHRIAICSEGYLDDSFFPSFRR